MTQVSINDDNKVNTAQKPVPSTQEVRDLRKRILNFLVEVRCNSAYLHDPEALVEGQKLLEAGTDAMERLPSRREGLRKSWQDTFLKSVVEELSQEMPSASAGPALADGEGGSVGDSGPEDSVPLLPGSSVDRTFDGTELHSLENTGPTSESRNRSMTKTLAWSGRILRPLIGRKGGRKDNSSIQGHWSPSGPYTSLSS